jgi:putative transposase
VAIPKLRWGSYFPDWLLERRRRAEAALTGVVATCYLPGVSTRRMKKPVEPPGITWLSRSQISEMARDLDEQLEAFRTRPLDAGPYTFAAADVYGLKVREGGRVVNVHALLAVGSTPTSTAKSWACRSPAPSTAPGGWRSSGT